jgi:3-oxoacyl-[acyl-carrier-protein] synthase-3
LGAYTKALFNLDPVEGGKAFNEFGKNAPPALALSLIERNKLIPRDVTVISHQASSVLLDQWRETIGPKQYLDTMAEFGNLTLASMGVTFAHRYDEIETNHVVLLGIGVQQETSALLLKRRES